MYGELAAAIQSVRSLGSLLKAANSLGNFNELTLAVSDVTTKLMAANDRALAAQEQQMTLTARVRELEAELAAMHKEKEGAALQPGQNQSEPLDEVAEKLLRAVCLQANLVDYELARMADDISAPLAMYHLENMLRAGLVNDLWMQADVWSGHSPRREWYIEQKGRAYLVQRGLL